MWWRKPLRPPDSWDLLFEPCSSQAQGCSRCEHTCAFCFVLFGDYRTFPTFIRLLSKRPCDEAQPREASLPGSGQLQKVCSFAQVSFACACSVPDRELLGGDQEELSPCLQGPHGPIRACGLLTTDDGCQSSGTASPEPRQGSWSELGSAGPPGICPGCRTRPVRPLGRASAGSAPGSLI